MPEELTIHERIERDRKKNAGDVLLLKKFRKYAEGLHDNKLTEKQKKILEGLLENGFADNLCHQIPSEANDRIEFQRWTCEDEQVQEFLSDIYTQEKLEDLQGEIHYSALLDGNTAVAVNWDADLGTLRVYHEDWWDGCEGVYIHFSPDGRPRYAVKEWIPEGEPDGTKRRTIWYEGEGYLQRWKSEDSGASWVQINLDSDPVQGGEDIPWMRKDGTPLHIPYVLFPNAGRTRKKYGTSELAGGVLGFQDQINDLQLAMSGAGRLTAFQMIWISGIEADNVEVGPGKVLTSSDPASRFGTLPPGDLSQLLNLYNQKLRSVARMTRTPLHVITGGDWPSGEALLRAEQPAVGKADRQVKRFKSCWTEVAHRAVELRNRFGTGPELDEDIKTAVIRAVFAPTERRDLLSKSVVVNNLGDKISNQEALRIIGYNDEQAEQIAEEQRTEQKTKAQDMLDTFNAGQAAGTELPGSGPKPPSAPKPGQGNQTSAGTGTNASGGTPKPAGQNQPKSKGGGKAK